MNEYENIIIVFDDFLGSSNSNHIDQFFERGRHNNLHICYLSQYFFDLPKRTLGNIGQRNILFTQTYKHIEETYRDIGGYDMRYDEFKHLCRKSREENYNYLCFGRFKKSNKGTHCSCEERRNTFKKCTPETKTFE